jgi:AraC-like DNA-binding protein
MAPPDGHSTPGLAASRRRDDLSAPYPDATRPAEAGGGGPLRPMVISTETVEPRHRFSMWRDTYGSFNVLEPIGDPPPDFSARNAIWSFGGLALMRNTAPAMAFSRTARHVRRDAIDHWVARVAHSGRSRLRLGSDCFAIRPGVPFLLSLGDPADGDRTDVDWLSLYIPRDDFPDLSAGLAALGPGALEAPSASLLADWLLLLERRMPEMTAAQVPVLVEATRSVVAACLLAGPGAAAASRGGAPAEVEVAQLERVRRLVRRHIGSATLSPARLCRLAGVSRSQLCRLFEPHGGVARYVQGVRLRTAHAMLSDPACATPIAEVGERLGFFDPSTFSRAFRREFGYAPGEARAAAVRGGLLPRAPEAPRAAPSVLDFGGLLRRLGAGGRGGGARPQA